MVFRYPQIPPYRQHSGDRISDLMLEGGRIGAEGALRSGEIWGSTVSNLGQMLGGALQQHLEKSQMAKRDAAIAAAIGTWDGQDPNMLLAHLVRIAGPEKGPDLAHGVLAFHGLMTKQEGLEEEKAIAQESEQIQTIVKAWKDYPPILRIHAYETLRTSRPELVARHFGVEPEQLPERLTPEIDELIGSFGRTEGGAGFTLGPGEMRFNAAGEPIAEGPPKEEKRFKVTVPGPGGRPIEKLVSESELAAGIRSYERPPSIQPVVIQTAEGPKLLDKATGTTRDISDTRGKALKLAPTAEMRNKAEGRKLVSSSINALKDLSSRIITKVGPQQRAEALKRGAAAVYGKDPEFRTYQDARVALAGNLAVAQQGSRPSDADIKAVWLPLVPDPYRDTQESMRMKWKLIETMSLPTAQGAPGGPSGTADPLGLR